MSVFVPARPRRRLTAVLAAVGVGLIALVPFQHLIGLSPAATPLAVHVSGNHLVDGAGHPLTLRGADLSGTEFACIQGGTQTNRGWSIYGGQPFDSAATYAAMAAWHINVVRVPLNEDCWLGINGVNPAYGGVNYQNAIQTEVSLIHQAGMYAVLDLHWSSPGAYAAYWQEPMGDADHSPAFWQSLAASFKSDPAVIFDLYNEPFLWSSYTASTSQDMWACWLNGCAMQQFVSNDQVGPDGTTTGYTTMYNWTTAGMQQMLDAVRATGAAQPVLVNGLDWSNDDSGWLAHAPSDTLQQIVVGAHIYPNQGCSTLACWNSVYPAIDSTYPVLVGETGDNTTAPTTFLSTFLNYAEGARWNYLAWTWNPWTYSSNVLITDWAGTPNAGEGTTFRNQLVAVAAAPTPSGSTPAPTPTPSPATSPSGTAAPSFDDEFSGTSADTTLWTVNNNPNGTTSNAEKQCYLPANVTEAGGLLTETAKVASSCVNGYTSGAVQTKYTFTYGTVDIRAKLAGGTGPWPAIWLLGAGCQPWRMGTGCNPAWPQPGSDEIDIAELLNSNHSAINEQVHASAGSPGCFPTVSDASQNWHDYTLVWAPGSLTWKIDGQTTCTQTGAVVPSHPMFLILDTAVGGTAAGSINNSTLPQSSSFDYVRITPQGGSTSTPTSPAPTPAPTASPTPAPTPAPTSTPTQTPGPTPAPTQTPSAPLGTVLYSDSFAGDTKGQIPSGWSVYGSNAGFAIANCKASPCYSHNGWTSSTAENAFKGGDYTLSVDVDPSAWQSEVDGVDVRYTDAKDYYSARFVGANEIQFGKLVDDGSYSGKWTELASAPLPYGASWHHVVITAYGPTFTVSVDGRQLITTTDSTFPGGRVGFDANAPVKYSNVVVTA